MVLGALICVQAQGVGFECGISRKAEDKKAESDLVDVHLRRIGDAIKL